MKRTLASLFIVLASMALVFAGGSAESTASTASEGPDSIVWAGWSGEEEASRDIFTRMREGYQAQSGNT